MKFLGLFLFCVMLRSAIWSAPTPRHVLLVTSSDLKPAWGDYVSWKEKQGFSVTLLTTQQISDSYEGPDLQEKIRKCVRSYIDEHKVTFVVLGGDSLPDGGGIVPDRDTRHENMWGIMTDLPTDIYYLSPTNWDADGDGVYGEFQDDHTAITYPDGTVGLGRIPVRTADQVISYTAKVISYESNYPQGNFGRSFTYMCEVSAAYPKLKTSWEDHISKVFEDPLMSWFYAEYTPWDGKAPGDFPLSPENIVQRINAKDTGKFHVHGHGLFFCWVLEDGALFTKQHVEKLTNKDAYPVITTVSCFTGQFDGWGDPSIAESMLRVADAGAIAIVAPSREGKPHFVNPSRDMPLMMSEGKMDGTTTTMTLFWAKGIGEKLTTGEALMQTKASLATKAKESPNFHMCLSELNLLGDPTILVHPAHQ